MISVILTTYNRAERLKKAIESVLNQSFTDFELIIVDDASTDNTYEVVKSYTDERIKYIKRDKNFGNDTRPKNEGIIASKGEYIALLDDDVMYRTEHLSILYNEILKHPEVVMIYGDRWIVDERGEIPSQVGISSDFNPALLFQRNYIDTSDVLIRREAVFSVGGFDEKYKKYIDWNMWLRMVKYGYKFSHIPLIITDYHLCADSKSFRKEDEKGFSIPAWIPTDIEIELNYLGKKPEPRVAVYTLTHDRVEYTKECLETLYETAGFPFDHYIFDNGSQDSTPEYLKTLKPHKWCRDIHVSYSPDNKGISIASNMIKDVIFEKQYQVIGKVDNDAYFKTDGWLKAIVDTWKRNHLMALSVYIEGLKDNPGGAPRITYGSINGEVIGITKHIGGIVHFVDSRAHKTHRHEENMPLHWYDDLAFSRYLLSQGYQMGYLENYFTEHRDGTIKQHEKYPDYFKRREEIELVKSYGEINDSNGKP